MKHVKVTPAFNSDRNRMADLEAPTPATEQYEYWDEESESGTYRLTTGQFLLASVVVIMGAIALVL
jgi:hypothetical protein